MVLVFVLVFVLVEGQGTGTCHTGAVRGYFCHTDCTDGSSLGWGLRSLLFQLFLEELAHKEAAFFLKVGLGDKLMVGVGRQNYVEGRVVGKHWPKSR